MRTRYKTLLFITFEHTITDLPLPPLGLPESTAPFCSTLSRNTSCVAISISYRFAPHHPYPTAHDDVRDTVRWLSANATRLWKADGRSITVSGFSAGGNLALDLATAAEEREGLPQVESWVGFYSPLDLATPPWLKPKPPGFPKRDPLAFLLPLFDAYGASAQQKDPASKRANPCLRHNVLDLAALPENMLFIVAGVDILLQEQVEFIPALESSIAGSGREEHNLIKVESEVYEGGFHGWLELPDYVLRRPRFKVVKYQALERAGEFLQRTMKSNSDKTP